MTKLVRCEREDEIYEKELFDVSDIRRIAVKDPYQEKIEFEVRDDGSFKGYGVYLPKCNGTWEIIKDEENVSVLILRKDRG